MRLFLGVFPSVETRTAIEAVQRKAHTWIATKGSWTKPEKFHITLKFFGETAPESVIRVQTEEAIREVQAFKLNLVSVGGFPDSRLKRVLFLEPSPDTELHRVMRYWGTPAEPNNKPHVTIARFNQPVEIPRGLKFEPIEFSVNSIRLIDSVHVASESNYRLVHEWKLEG